MVFFNGERGSETFPGYGLFDTSINYNIPVFSTLRPWVKFDVYNLFNNQKLIGWNTAVTQTAASAKDGLGLATGYTPGATFGTATGNVVTNLYTHHHQRVSGGVRRRTSRRPHLPRGGGFPVLDRSQAQAGRLQSADVYRRRNRGTRREKSSLRLLRVLR